MLTGRYATGILLPHLSVFDHATEPFQTDDFNNPVPVRLEQRTRLTQKQAAVNGFDLRQSASKRDRSFADKNPADKPGIKVLQGDITKGVLPELQAVFGERSPAWFE